MLKDIYRILLLGFAFVVILASSCDNNNPEFDIVDIPCEPRAVISSDLDSVNLGANLKIFAPSSSIILHQGDQASEQIIIEQSNRFKIAIGYCNNLSEPDPSDNCANYELFLEGLPTLELPLTYDANPMTAHPIYNTPFVMLVCQDSEAIAGLIWKDPTQTTGEAIAFDLFLNLEKSATLFSAGSGIAESEAAFQQVKNIINTVSKR